MIDLFFVGAVICAFAAFEYRAHPERYSLRGVFSCLAWFVVAVFGVAALVRQEAPFLSWVAGLSPRVSGVFGLLLLDDFVQYWAHRCAHAFPPWWAGHRVHHSCSDFNLLVSIRSSPLEQVFATGFLGIEVFAGYSPELVIAVRTCSIIVQNSMHRISRVEVPEIVRAMFVTPSFHELHHASNKPYWDRNFGAVLSVWDEVFGTRVERTEVPVYGVR